MNDKKYLFGLALVILGFLAVVVSYYLLYFALPVFAAGALLVFLSRQTLIRKLATIILPITLWLPATYGFLTVFNYTTPKTFLIPAACEGTIRIVYEDNCGVILAKENGREILVFPENGILVLRQKFNGGVNNEYYLVDKNGARTPVKQILDFKDRAKYLPAIQVGGAGTIAMEGKEIKFSDFYLYNKDTANIDNEHFTDSLTNEIVQLCRKNPKS